MKTSMFFYAVYLACAAVAVAATDVTTFDSDKDGVLNDDELMKYAVTVAKSSYSDIDTNLDWQVSPEEKSAFLTPFRVELTKNKSKGNPFVEPVMTPVPVADVVGIAPPPESEPFRVWVLSLRSDYKELTKGLDESDPASFGYFRNNDAKTDTWYAVGTLGWPYKLEQDRDKWREDDRYWLEHLQIIPSVSWNRVTGSDDPDRDEANSLVFRIGGEARFLGNYKENPLFSYISVLGSVRAATDFDLDQVRWAGELDFEPVREKPNINAQWMPLGSHFLYRTRFTAHAEFGENADEIGGNSTYLKAGPQFEVHLEPVALPRMQLYAKYTFLWELVEGADIDYLETGLRYAFDSFDQVFVELSYKVGNTPVTFKDIDLLHIGLAVKF